mmetsp:Transcript_9648/g.16201  ORF Transcript_9648/g.16201 Transcript_9648/m.16201 type:complete len:144 (+) Transcript_9648:1319-1750(+)
MNILQFEELFQAYKRRLESEQLNDHKNKRLNRIHNDPGTLMEFLEQIQMTHYAQIMATNEFLKLQDDLNLTDQRELDSQFEEEFPQLVAQTDLARSHHRKNKHFESSLVVSQNTQFAIREEKQKPRNRRKKKGKVAEGAREEQ